MVSAEPVSTKNTTTVSLIVAVTENENLELTIDTDILNTLKISLVVRAASPMDSIFPDLKIS